MAKMRTPVRRNIRSVRFGDQLLGFAMALPAVALLVIFVIWPIITAADYSTTSASGYGDKNRVGLDNFARALTDQEFIASFGRNVVFAVGVVAAVLVVGSTLSYLLFRRVAGWRPLQIILMVPYIMPLVVTALLWQFMLEPTNGLVNTGLRSIGLGSLAGPWLTGEATSLASVGVVQVWTTIPFAVLILFGAMLALPTEVIEAAAIDGAGHVVTMFRVVLPMIRPTIILVGFVVALQLFRSFDLVYLLTQGGPISSSTIATLYVFVQGFVNNEYGYANALALILGIVLAVLATVPRLLGRRLRRTAEVEE